MFPGTLLASATDLAASRAATFLAVTGSFVGNVTLGGETFFAEEGAFVAKMSASDGSVAWAISLDSSSASAAAFDDVGNVAVVGKSCDAENCVGFVALFHDADGSLMWRREWSTAQFPDIAFQNKTFYVVGELNGPLDDFPLAPASDYSEALLVSLDAIQGQTTWARTMATLSNHSTSSFLSVTETAVYFDCRGACADTMDYGGAIAKVSLFTGEPLWVVANLPEISGLAANDDGVYVSYATSDDLTYGDASFPVWGSTVHFFAKLNAASGKGEWVLQAGGHSADAAGHVVLDNNGDLYALGLTNSHPSYFEPIFVEDLHHDHDHHDHHDHDHNETDHDHHDHNETDHDDLYHNETDHDHHYNETDHDEDHDHHHNETDHDHDHDHDHHEDEYDLYIVKLKTSAERLPPCKTDSNTIARGFCFVANACYEDGEASRNDATEDCLRCLTNVSQTALSPEPEGHYLFANGTCLHLDRRLYSSAGKDTVKDQAASSFFASIVLWFQALLLPIYGN